MKIVLKETGDINHNDIYIQYHYSNYKSAKEISEIILINSENVEVIDEHYHIKNTCLNHIYYFQSYDHKIYCYYDGKRRQIKTKDRNKFKKKIIKYGFIQINRTTYINMNYVLSYKIIHNSNRLVRLHNGEEIIVSRKYKNSFDFYIKNQ